MKNTTDKQLLRIGVVGLGEHALRSHVEPLLKIENATIVAGYDPNEEARKRFENLTNAVAYSSEEMLYNDGNVDAVIVCSPDRFHGQAILNAVEHGVHTLVEKPILDEITDQLGLTDIAKAFDNADSAGLVISSCHPRRFDRPYLWLKSELDNLAEQLGEIMEIRLDFFYHAPSKTGLHHGLLIDHINHEIDLVHFLIGHSPFSAHKLADSETHYAVSGHREDGITFHFHGSRNLNRRVYPETALVRFQRGTVEIDTGTGRARIVDYDRDDIKDVPCGKTDYEGRFRAVNENFVNACLGQETSYLTFDDMLVNTEMGIILTFADLVDLIYNNSHYYKGSLMDSLRTDN